MDIYMDGVLGMDIIKSYSIHNLYMDLQSKNMDITILLDYLDNNINYEFYCCSTHHTILSYSLTKTINIKLVKDILDNGGNIQFELTSGYTPIYYLFLYQELDIIEKIMNYTKTKLDNNYKNRLLELSISNNNLPKTIYLIDGDYSIIFSNNLQFVITKYNNTSWYKILGQEIFYILSKANNSKYNNLFSNLSDDIIRYIYFSIFI